MRKFLLFLFVLIGLAVVAKQSQKGSSKKNLVEADDTLAHTNITEWVGKKITFLRTYNSKIDFDYVSFTGGSGFKGRPTYAECYDHEALVESVTPDSAGEYRVKVKMLDKNHKEYIGRTFHHTLSRVALVDDIEKTERFLIGKIFWMKVDYWYYLDEEKEQLIIKYGHKFKKVRVTRVSMSMDDNAPFEISLTDEMGEVGVLNININNTNVEASLHNKNLLSKFFFKHDPHKLYNWESDTWHDVMNKQIYKGMTREQAVLSWGDPDETVDLKDGSIKYKYDSGGSFIIKDGKVTDVKQ